MNQCQPKQNKKKQKSDSSLLNQQNTTSYTTHKVQIEFNLKSMLVPLEIGNALNPANIFFFLKNENVPKETLVFPLTEDIDIRCIIKHLIFRDG